MYGLYIFICFFLHAKPKNLSRTHNKLLKSCDSEAWIDAFESPRRNKCYASFKCFIRPPKHHIHSNKTPTYCNISHVTS